MVDQKLSSSSELTPSAANAPAAASSGRAVREVLETLLLAALIFIGVRLVVLISDREGPRRVRRDRAVVDDAPALRRLAAHQPEGLGEDAAFC